MSLTALIALVRKDLKLFFHDLAAIGSVYRIAALIVVAIIALATSFLYQRFFDQEDKS